MMVTGLRRKQRQISPENKHQEQDDDGGGGGGDGLTGNMVSSSSSASRGAGGRRGVVVAIPSGGPTAGVIAGGSSSSLSAKHSSINNHRHRHHQKKKMNTSVLASAFHVFMAGDDHVDDDDDDDDDDDCSDNHDHPLPFFRRLLRRLLRVLSYPQTHNSNSNSNINNKSTRSTVWRIWWLRSSWIFRGMAFLLLLNLLVFYIRYFTMGRPSWLYGSPMDIKDVQACLALGSADGSRGGSSGSSRRSSTNIGETINLYPSAVYWEWHRFASSTHNNSTTPTLPAANNKPRQHQHQHQHQQKEEEIRRPKNKTPRQRLLIAQYSGYGKYAEMLDVVAPVNAAYAKAWGHDVVFLQGTALSFDGLISSTCNDEPRSTFNKIPLLELALSLKTKYDQVLILDTDAMIVDFEMDITTLLQPSTTGSSYLLAAHRVWKYDWTNTWDINAGITLWNLHHPTLPQVLERWKELALSNPFLVVERNDDQYFLQRTLLELGWWTRAVYSLNHALEYYDATVIKHFKRDARSWSRTSLEQRLLRIQETIQDMILTTSSCSPTDSGGDHAASDGTSVSSLPSCHYYPLTTKFANRQRPTKA